MLEDEVWLAAVPDYHARITSPKGHPTLHAYCCLSCVESCVETRLGRKLTTKDFTNAKINSALFWGYSLAKRERFEESVHYMSESGFIKVDDVQAFVPVQTIIRAE